jgi:hypothetical protein
MTLMGLVLSWSTINAAQKAVKAGSIKLETNETGIFRMSSRAKLIILVKKVTTHVTRRATNPLMMLNMLYAYCPKNENVAKDTMLEEDLLN